jgi:hypothetical protein
MVAGMLRPYFDGIDLFDPIPGLEPIETPRHFTWSNGVLYDHNIILYQGPPVSIILEPLGRYKPNQKTYILNVQGDLYTVDNNSNRDLHLPSVLVGTNIRHIGWCAGEMFVIWNNGDIFAYGVHSRIQVPYGIRAVTFGFGKNGCPMVLTVCNKLYHLKKRGNILASDSPVIDWYDPGSYQVRFSTQNGLTYIGGSLVNLDGVMV